MKRWPIGLGVFVVLALLTDTLLTVTGAIQPLNDAVTRATYHLEHPWLDLPMIVVTYLGTDPVLFVIAIGVALYLARRGRPFDGILLVGAGLAARLLGIVTKVVFELPRPQLHQPPPFLSPLYGYGYPSGHALMSMAILALSAIMLLQVVQRKQSRVVIGSICSVSIVGVGFSRVYLGFHWVNDVVGGYLYGALVVLLAYATQMHYQGRKWKGYDTVLKRLVGQAHRPVGKGKEPSPR